MKTMIYSSNVQEYIIVMPNPLQYVWLTIENIKNRFRWSLDAALSSFITERKHAGPSVLPLSRTLDLTVTDAEAAVLAGGQVVATDGLYGKASGFAQFQVEALRHIGIGGYTFAVGVPVFVVLTWRNKVAI